MSLTALIVILVVLALVFDFVNGWNDSANAIATVIATRVLSPWTAVCLASVLNLAGAMVGVEVADTVAKIIHSDPAHIADGRTVLVIVIAGILSAAAWAALMTVMGMPISGTHSLIGGVIGSAVAAAGADVLRVEKVTETLLAMLLAPTLGFIAAYFFYVGLVWLTVRWKPTTMNQAFGKLQVLSASWMAFTHGTNDAQKVMGIITLALIAGGFQDAPAGKTIQVQLWVKLACAAAISLGTAVGGWKVIKTLGHHLTKLGPPEGFAVETSAALVLTLTAVFGTPASTTHTITGAILGLGATRGMVSVRWGLGEKILLAWIFTLPATATLGGAIYWVLTL
ncbi:MAG: inorganic phosphate transporter [Planctomycetia bacterium]|nr:inorganic phosphate transporter [Planctomycetia bacterium]